MIKVDRCKDDPSMMQIDLVSDAETISQEYVGLTLKLMEQYPMILDRAQWYLEDIAALKKIKKEAEND